MKTQKLKLWEVVQSPQLIAIASSEFLVDSVAIVEVIGVLRNNG